MIKNHKIVLLFFVINVILVCYKHNTNNDVLTLLVYFLVLNISSYFFIRKSTISLKNIFHLFMYLFFGVAPLLQYKSSTYFFGNKRILTDYDMFYGALLSLSIIVIYNIFYFLFFNRISNRIRFTFFEKQLNNYFNFKKILIISSFILLIFITSIFFNVKSFVTGIHLKGLVGYDYYTITFFRDVIRLIPLFFLLHYKQNNIKSLRVEICLIVFTLLLNFPTAISRFQVGLVYLPLIFTYFKRIKKCFSLIFFLSFLVIFPFLHNFRFDLSLKRESTDFFNMFNTLHFDTFQNTLSVIKLNIITNGEQLLGSFLFFFPRNFWEQKPVASSLLLCDKLEFEGFCNIALSFFGEGYINFGYYGLIIFLIVLAFTNAFFDEIYLKSKSTMFKSLYFILVFFEFYLLRGSLTSSIQKLAIIIFSLFIYFSINQLYIKKPSI